MNKDEISKYYNSSDTTEVNNDEMISYEFTILMHKIRSLINNEQTATNKVLIECYNHLNQSKAIWNHKYRKIRY